MTSVVPTCNTSLVDVLVAIRLLDRPLFLSEESPLACLLAAEALAGCHAVDEPVLGLQVGQRVKLMADLLDVPLQQPLALLQGLILHQHLLFQLPVLLGNRELLESR